MSVHSVRFIVAPNSFPVMPDQIGHLPSAKVVIIIEKRCRSIAFVAQSQTSNLSILAEPTLHIKTHSRLHKSRLAKLLEKSESEDFSMLIDNQCITR